MIINGWFLEPIMMVNTRGQKKPGLLILMDGQ